MDKADREYYWDKVFPGCFITGATYIVVYVLLGLSGFTYDSWPSIPISNHPWALIFFGAVLFVVPFSIGALYFTKAFRHRQRPAVDVITALILAWAGEKLAILGISSLLYGMGIWRLGPLLYRISAGGDQSAPWFTLEYIALTLIGCVLLGILVPKLNWSEKTPVSRGNAENE